MCLLKRKVKLPKKGYKVVILRNGKKYSPAMGIIYRDDKPIRPPKVQKRLTTVLRSDILNPKAGHGFSHHMIGRTAIFKNLLHAKSMMRDFAGESLINSSDELAIFKAIVSKDVMSGLRWEYIGDRVYAGKIITFGERVM